VLDVNRESVMGLVVMYKRTTRLLQWSPNNSVYRCWECKGVFPTSIDAGDLTYASPDKKMITIALSVDKAYPAERSNTNPAQLNGVPAAGAWGSGS